MANPVLRVKDLEVSVQNNIILKDISFEIERGKTVAVIGPNGAGKSTLFRALLNVLPYNGSIEWMNDLTKSYIPQTISVSEIPITVEEFLSMKGIENIDRALRNVELQLETVKGKLLSVLSGGELQRVLIAWAIIDEPDVLLFDEPTSGVDTGNEEVVYSMLNKLKEEKGVTIMLISHDLHIVDEYADYVLVLRNQLLYYGKKENIEKRDILRMIYGESSILLETSLLGD
jgi:zinc transport system ATP-binding protein